MIGYTLKHVLELIPEAAELVKSANIEQEWPLASKADCLASSLGVAYKSRVAGEYVDFDLMTKIATATEAYGLTEKAAELATEMHVRSTKLIEKSASLPSADEFLVKQAYFEGELTGLMKLDSITKQAEELFEESQKLGVTPKNSVLVYSGNSYLNKQAALDALGARFYASNNDTFLKIAAALSKEAEVIPPSPLVKNLCNTVSQLDKKAGLSARGFNFFKESLITKEAAAQTMNVNVAGRTYPLSKLMETPPEYVNQYLGEGFMEEVTADPAAAKAMVEALPMDSQQVLAQVLRNVG